MTAQHGSSAIRISRRGFLAAAAIAGGSASLAGCGQGFGSSGGGSINNDVTFTIPDPPDGFPTDDVKVRVLTPQGGQEEFWDALIPAYTEKFPNVEFQHDAFTAEQIQEIVPLGFRNGTTHDLTLLARAIRIQNAVADKQLLPLDECIPNFSEWQSHLPEMGKIEGIQVFDGKQYAVTPISSKRHDAITHYHKKLLNDAGFDPATEPLTWDTFREACKKVTQAGNGKAFGFALEMNQTGRLQTWFGNMARLHGQPGGNGINHLTGEYVHNSEEMLAVVELVQAIQSDGSMFPGSANLTAPDVWARVLRGNAAMCGAGPWVAVQWLKDDPDFEFGVAQMPVATDDPLPLAYQPFGGNPLHIPSTTKVREVAGHILGYVTSPDGQAQLGKINGPGNPPYLAEPREQMKKLDLAPQELRCLELADEKRYGPTPAIRNPDTEAVQRRMKRPNPNLGQVLQAILVGKESNPKQALTALRDASEKALDAAIVEAKKKDGSTATREDYVFPNWDPREDYTLDKYEKLS